jgi:hypothetical protein
MQDANSEVPEALPLRYAAFRRCADNSWVEYVACMCCRSPQLCQFAQPEGGYIVQARFTRGRVATSLS